MKTGILCATLTFFKLLIGMAALAQPPKSPTAAKPGASPANKTSSQKAKPKFTEAQLSRFFFGAAYGKLDQVKEGIEIHGIPVNLPSEYGVTALQLALANYPTDQIRDSDNYLKFYQLVEYLMQKGADPQVKTSDSLNCLQAAVKSGRYPAVQHIHMYDRNQFVRDREGNSLLHLATQHPYDFYKNSSYMEDIIKKFPELDKHVKNDKGQNPLCYFLSTPQKNSPYAIDIVRTLLNYNFNPYTADNSGKNVYAYVESTNNWLKPWLTQYDLAEAESRRKMKELDEQWKRQTAENLAKYEAWKKNGMGESGNLVLNESFTATYNYNCHASIDANAKQKTMFRSALPEPVTVVVTPTTVSISTLAPVYGTFKIASSGYEIIDGGECEVYYFEQTANNSTYKGIAFNRGKRYARALLKTSSGLQFICNF